MKRLFTLVAVVSLLTIGCGNDDLSSSVTQPDTGAPDDTTTDDTTTDISGSDAGDTGGSADGLGELRGRQVRRLRSAPRDRVGR